MIHVFNYRDKNYIYDVGSGSLHECDKATADYLKAKEEGQAVDITYITDEQIQEILSDVEGLKEQGLLFKDEVKTYPMKSNEIKALLFIFVTIVISVAVIVLPTRARTTPNARVCPLKRRKRRWISSLPTAAIEKCWKWTFSAASR